MKLPVLLLQTILAGLIASSTQAVTISVGDDSDLVPAGPTPNLDGAQPMIIVDYQANLYTNASGGDEMFSVDTFNFFAQGDGDVTPFVALLTGIGTDAGDYDVLALGATRNGGGADFSSGAVVSLPFGDSPVVTIPDGATLVGGIQQGTSLGNVVPFNSNSGFDTFITGGGGAGDASELSTEGDITPGGTTWSTLSGGRNYEFTIELNTALSADSDGDGLPDAWEDEHGLDEDDNGENPNNNGVAGNPDNGASGDPDGDGLNNLGEFENGADPNDTDSDDDTLLDNDEVLGAGARPPTRPNRADTDNDGLGDLAETNTGTFVDETDTGSDPTKKDTDGDTIDDGDEVAGNNELGFTSNPNLVDTDGDGVDDNTEIGFGTDPNDPGDRPSGILIGDGAPLGSEITDLGGADTANAGNVTYALQGFPYTNTSGGTEMFEVASFNFWADSPGDVTPYVANYNGLGFGFGANFVMLAVGDPISVADVGLNNVAFTTDGEPPTIAVEDGETIIAGFHQSAGVVPFGQPGDADADYIDEENEIGLVGEPLGEDAQWSTLNRTYAFNISLEPTSSIPFAIVGVSVDTVLSSATVTWNSRTRCGHRTTCRPGPNSTTTSLALTAKRPRIPRARCRSMRAGATTRSASRRHSS